MSEGDATDGTADPGDDDRDEPRPGSDEGGDRRSGPAAAYAPNWRTVLAVDGAAGGLVLLAGLVLTFRWNPVGGGFLASLGLVYLVLVARRARDWAAWRRAAGLP